MKYNKPLLSIEQQVEQLAARGLAIPDKVRAAHYLAHPNYYRLRAYWLPLERDPKQHSFKDGASFEHALDLYVFDRKLRLLLLDAIERIGSLAPHPMGVSPRPSIRPSCLPGCAALQGSHQARPIVGRAVG